MARSALQGRTLFVTFHGHRAGIGRTTTLVEVARNLVTKGRRVLLWDLDFSRPGLQDQPAFAATALPPRGFAHWLTGFAAGQREAETVLRCVTPVPAAGPGRLGLVAAHGSGASAEDGQGAVLPADAFAPDVPWQRVRQLLANADPDGQSAWDYVLVDAAPGATPLARLATAMLADLLVEFTPLAAAEVATANRVVSELRNVAARRGASPLAEVWVACPVPAEAHDLWASTQAAGRIIGRPIAVHVPIESALLLGGVPGTDSPWRTACAQLADRLVKPAGGVTHVEAAAPPPAATVVRAAWLLDHKFPARMAQAELLTASRSLAETGEPRLAAILSAAAQQDAPQLGPLADRLAAACQAKGLSALPGAFLDAVPGAGAPPLDRLTAELRLAEARSPWFWAARFAVRRGCVERGVAALREAWAQEPRQPTPNPFRPGGPFCLDAPSPRGGAAVRLFWGRRDRLRDAMTSRGNLLLASDVPGAGRTWFLRLCEASCGPASDSIRALFECADAPEWPAAAVYVDGRGAAQHVQAACAADSTADVRRCLSRYLIGVTRGALGDTLGAPAAASADFPENHTLAEWLEANRPPPGRRYALLVDDLDVLLQTLASQDRDIEQVIRAALQRRFFSPVLFTSRSGLTSSMISPLASLLEVHRLGRESETVRQMVEAGLTAVGMGAATDELPNDAPFAVGQALLWGAQADAQEETPCRT